MQRTLSVGLLAFAVTLAVVIGLRMSAEAMAIVIGVIFGLAAGLPASLLLASFARREEPAAASPRASVVREVPREAFPASPLQSQPPVIIVNPPSPGASGWPPYSMNAWPAIPPVAASPRREARVIGEEAEEERGW